MPISAYTRSRGSSSTPFLHARNESTSTASTSALTPAPSVCSSGDRTGSPAPAQLDLTYRPARLGAAAEITMMGAKTSTKGKQPAQPRRKVPAARRPATRLACQRLGEGRLAADRPSPAHPYFPTYPTFGAARTASGSTSRTASASASGSASNSPPPLAGPSSTASGSRTSPQPPPQLPSTTLGYNPHTTLEQAAAELRAIKDRLGRWGMRAKEVKADGGCMFRALSDQMFGTQMHHLEIRHVVCNHLEHNPSTYAPYLVHADFGRSYAAYVTNMRKPGTWAGDMELAAFCRTFDRRVMVVHHDYIQQATEDPLPLPLASPRYIRTRVDAHTAPRSSDPLLQRLLTQPATPEDEVLVVAFHESGAHWWSSRKADGSGPGMREDVLEAAKPSASALLPAEPSIASGTPPSSIIPLDTPAGTSSQKSITSDMDVDAALVVEAGSASASPPAPGEALADMIKAGRAALPETGEVLADLVEAGRAARAAPGEALEDMVKAGRSGKARTRKASSAGASSTGIKRDARSRTAETNPGDKQRKAHKGWVWEEVDE